MLRINDMSNIIVGIYSKKMKKNHLSICTLI